MAAHPVSFIKSFMFVEQETGMVRAVFVESEEGEKRSWSTTCCASNSHNMPPVALAPRVKLVSFSTKAAFLLTALARWTLQLWPAGDWDLLP